MLSVYRHSFECVCLLLSLVHGLLMLASFWQGHYIIPTVMAGVALIFFHLGRAGLRGVLWVKKLLANVVTALCLHLLFSLFFAKTPKLVLQSGFYPVYSVLLLLLLYLLFRYIKENRLYSIP